jgi:imidazolonepropionase-like amidohydrolase
MKQKLLGLAVLTSTILSWAGVAPPWAITNARIVIAPGKTIAQGAILLRDGLIQAAGETVAIPPDALIYDAKGLTVCAGWIDAATYVGFPAVTPTPAARTGATAIPEDINAPERYLSPIPAGVFADVSAALKLTAPSQPDPRRNLGFTTVLSVPREGLWQGSSALVNLAGATAPDRIVRTPVAMHVSFATARGSYPSALMGAIAILRQTLVTAQQYREAVGLYEKAGGSGIPRPRYDAVSVALLPVLDGKAPVVFKADTAQQIRRAIRFADEFKLRPIIYGGAEAWRVSALLKERDIPVLLDLALKAPPRGSMFGGGVAAEAEPAASPKRFAAESNPGRLEKAGVRFAFAGAALDRTDQILPQIRLAITRGLSTDGALAALTSAPAAIFGAASQLGSIEPGKIADLTLLDGEPFAEKTHAKAVVIDGNFYYPPVAPATPATQRNAAAAPPVPESGIAPERQPPIPQPAARDLVITNATILTVTKGTLDNGSIWVHDGKIKELGKTVSAPAGAQVIDATGQYIMPGIIDSHSHSAISGGINEGAPAISPQARIADVLDPEDIDLYRSLAGGVTTLNVLHGSANAIGGQNAVIKNKWSRPVDEMLFPGAPRGIKMALGENPKRSNFSNPTGPPRFPATRMGVEIVIRESFSRAREYARAWDDYRARTARGEKLLPPARNLGLETLADVLAGKILVHAHCYRADEISMLLDLADEFGFKIRSLQHVLEGYKVTEKIRRHGAGASTFADMWGYKMEAFDGTAYNAALMVKAGIRTAVNSDSDELARRLYGEAAKSMKYGGLTETQALRLITIDPAWMLGIDSRVGSIEVGKDADFAIFNGHPFSPYARVEKTIIDGQVFFDRARDLAQRIPWKEEFEPEPESRRPGPPPTDNSIGEASHE